MPEEEKKEGQETPSPASGEQPEVQPEGQPEGQKPEGEPEAGTAEQLAELQKQITEANERVEKLSKQNEQAGYVIQKLKDRMKEEGIEPDEKEGISEDRVRQIVLEGQKPVTEQLGKLSTTLSEMARAQKAQPSKGGGEGGQKPPEKKKAPVVSAAGQKLLQMAGLVWDADKEAYVKKNDSGRIVRVYKPEEVQKTITSA